jgi:hypothetical protein
MLCEAVTESVRALLSLATLEAFDVFLMSAIVIAFKVEKQVVKSG